MKERKTLWDFMRDHTTLVEDLLVASKNLKKGYGQLSIGLRKVADELKEYDHDLCGEWHSPFDEEQIWVLEYNPGAHQFHYNSSYKDKSFRQKLFSFGWFPVCVIPDCYSTDNGFTGMLSKIESEKLSYEEAVSSVYSWFIEKNAI